MSDGVKVWSADFDAFGNPLGFINEDPDNNCDYFSQPFRLPGQYALSPQEGGPTSTTGGLHENWNRIYDSSVGRYLEVDPMLSPSHLAPAYAAFDDAPHSRIDPRGLYTIGAGSCPNLPAALNKAKRWLGPGGKNTVDNCINCNACRSQFCACDIDDYLKQGTDPPLHFINLGWWVKAHTNCPLFQQSTQHPANSIAIDDGFCTNHWYDNNVDELADILLHELTHWCDCDQRGAVTPPVGTGAYDSGVDTERACGP